VKKYTFYQFTNKKLNFYKLEVNKGIKSSSKAILESPISNEKGKKSMGD